MSNYEEPSGKHTPDWPYPVNYGKENEVSAEVLDMTVEQGGGSGVKGFYLADMVAGKSGTTDTIFSPESTSWAYQLRNKLNPSTLFFESYHDPTP